MVAFSATQVLIWGIITTAQCGAKNFGAEMAIRIILGLFESVISVAFGIIVCLSVSLTRFRC
jgi:hypothetical protein